MYEAVQSARGLWRKFNCQDSCVWIMGLKSQAKSTLFIFVLVYGFTNLYSLLNSNLKFKGLHTE